MFSKRTLELIVDSLWPLLHVTNREGDRFSMSSSRVHRKNQKWPPREGPETPEITEVPACPLQEAWKGVGGRKA
jgi:hypothetical protein